MTKSTKAFYILLVLICLVQFGKFISPKIFLNQFHLQSKSFASWSFLQTIPSMYNYSNTVWISPYKVDSVALSDIINRDLEHVGKQFNHYPARVLSFRNDREKLLDGSIKSIYIRSEFTGHTIITAYEWNIQKNSFQTVAKRTYEGQ